MAVPRLEIKNGVTRPQRKEYVTQNKQLKIGSKPMLYRAVIITKLCHHRKVGLKPRGF